MKVRFGVGLGVQGLADESLYQLIVEDLERLGFDSIWLPERVAGGALDPTVALAVAAGWTQRLKLGTGVIVLPGRNPVMVAKQLATLDRLSDGRLLLAFGSGAADATEQQVFGVPDRERGKWLDETVPLIRQLWSGEAVDHEGPRFTFSGLSLRPKPKQKRIDIWLGGRGPYALRRIGRLADGWLPSFCSPEEAAKGRALIEQSASEAGRTIDPEHFGANLQYSRKPLSDRTVQALRARRPEVDLAALVPVGQPALRDSVHRFVEAGCSKFVLRPSEEPASWTEELEWLAEAVLPLTI